eukprot:8695848-Alexandrium_andersonii.AAC.1
MTACDRCAAKRNMQHSAHPLAAVRQKQHDTQRLRSHAKQCLLVGVQRAAPPNIRQPRTVDPSKQARRRPGTLSLRPSISR